MNPTTPKPDRAKPLVLALLIGVLLIVGIALFVTGVVFGSHYEYSDGSREYMIPIGRVLWLPLQLGGCAFMLGAVVVILIGLFRRRSS